jgi:hypothetical protein
MKFLGMVSLLLDKMWILWAHLNYEPEQILDLCGDCQQDRVGSVGQFQFPQGPGAISEARWRDFTDRVEHSA